MHSFTPLGTALYGILILLREVIARHASAFRAQAPGAVAAWERVNRLFHRFEALVLAWERGQLPTPRPRAPRIRKPASRAPRPGGFAWLGRLVPGTGGFGGTLLVFLEREDIKALITAAPQAGRILRPMLHALGWEPPAHLKLPPRPPRPRKPRPKAEPRRRLTPIHLTRAQIDRMTAAELTHLFGRLPPHFPLPIPNLNHIRRKIAAG